MLNTHTGSIALAMLVAFGCTSSLKKPDIVDPGPPQPLVETVPYQEILTPVPVRVGLPATVGIEQVLMLYRTFGTREWRSVPLERSGQFWQGAVDCLEVSTITGDLQFFLVGEDVESRVIAANGSPAWPFVVPIVYRAPDGPSALVGQAAPLRCSDPADCPPRFPGCTPFVPSRAPCGADADCGEGDYCAWDGYCDSVVPVFSAQLPGTQGSGYVNPP
jgi:hypothetical protein